MQINRISILNNKQQKTTQNKNINFGISLKRINPKRLLDIDSIQHRNKLGVAVENIEYFKNTNIIKWHWKHYLPKRGNPGRISDIDFAMNGSKTVKSRFFSSKYYSGTSDVEKRIRNYNPDKKLTSKYKEFFGKDERGNFRVKITTKYQPDGKTLKEVEKIKQHFGYGEPYDMTSTYFSEKGIRTNQNRVKGEYWESFKYDETGKKVTQSDNYNNYYHGNDYFGN